MHKGKFILFFCAFLAALTLGHAAQQIPISIETLTTKSDAVIQGKVIGIICKRDPDGRIFTEIRLNIVEQIKGNSNKKTFKMVSAGGILGSVRSGSVIAPKFKINEEVVVFLVFNSRGEAIPVGLNQGCFEVYNRAEKGPAMVRNAFHGSPKSTNSYAIIKRATGKFKPLTLAELKRRIRRAEK